MRVQYSHLFIQQLKSQKDMAKLFETPKHSRKHEKEKENKTTRVKKSSSTHSSPTKKSSAKSNHLSPTKRSNPSSKSSSQSKSSGSMSPSRPTPPSKVMPIPGSCKEYPCVVSSGESDHEVPLPSVPPQKPLVSGQNSVVSTDKQPPTKPTIQPFQAKKVSNLKQIGTQAKVVTPQQESSLLEKQNKELPSTRDSSHSITTRQTSSRSKQSSSQPHQQPVREVVTRMVKKTFPPPILPPPPPPPPFSHTYTYPQKAYYSQPQAAVPPPSRYHTYPNHYSYGSAYPYSHPLVTSYSASYYKPYH